ncbi:General secretion pathway protein OS=Castellaniella defragrans OX=75697 GN=HNR28_001960 PE=4 SV=1 [Castellaniella defragrans]
MTPRMTWARLSRRVDAWRFAAHRADYFEYLHAVLRGMQGRLTLRELFERDALRHGPGTVRGRLSRTWARTCELAGGDLYLTWRGCLPADELALIRTAQAFGNARLLACFQALAHHLGLLQQAQRLLWSTLGVAALAAGVASLLWLALPVWTVPALQQAFQGLPADYHGPWARALFACARFLRDWGVMLPLSAGVAFAWGICALPRTRGPVRRLLDRGGPWRLYRQVQALRLLALMSILLQADAGRSIQLRPVAVLFLHQASPWLAGHLSRVIGRIDRGLAGAEAFDTGLLDPEPYWYLQDMAQACGLAEALRMTHARMAALWLPRVGIQARFLRWGVLLSGVAMVLGIGLWHYAAIDELRRGWMMFHASQ